MKKVLYGTTALLAAGMFTAAAEAATPLKLTVGGYLNAWMGYTNLSEDDAGFRVNKFALGTDGEIAFTADTKLDNGIKIGAVAEIVIGSTNRFQQYLGDVYVYTETKYGKAELGATDNVAKKLHNGAPSAGVLSTEKLVDWLGLTNVNVDLTSTAINFDDNDKKISYFSPKFYGFQAAASYIPGDVNGGFGFGGADNGAQTTTINKAGAAFSNAYVVSAAYEGKFSGVTVGADIAFGDVNVTGLRKSMEQYSIGADVGFSGFTIGAGYTILDWNTNGLKDDKAFEFGVGYENGPYAVSANYFLSKDGKVAGVKQGKFQKYEVSGKYKLGAGVDAFATFAYIDVNREASMFAFNDLDKVWTIVTGLALNF